MQSTVVINEAWKMYHDFLCDIPRIFSQGKTIFHKRNEIKVFEGFGPTLVNVKKYRVPIFINRIAYTLFRKPKAVRAYHNALRLQQAGVGTASPIGYFLSRRMGLLAESYFVSEQLDMDDTYDRGRMPTEGQEDFYIALARYTAKIHTAGIYPKDYSPGNILYKVENGDFSFAMVDTNRMRFGTVTVEEGCANFARLWGRDSAFRLMAGEYAAARGADKETCIRWVMEQRARFWKKYARRHPINYQMSD